MYLFNSTITIILVRAFTLFLFVFVLRAIYQYVSVVTSFDQ